MRNKVCSEPSSDTTSKSGVTETLHPDTPTIHCTKPRESGKTLARLMVEGQFDQSYHQAGTMIIDRRTNLVSVRPKGRHRIYTLPLNSVAEYIVHSVIKAESNGK